MTKEQIYTRPECHAIEVEAQAVLCASGEFIAGDPFNDSTEEEW